jgi:hypothetical protein
MVVEDSDKEDYEEEYEEAYEEQIEEAEVDFREELIISIEVIRREKKKNKKLQAELDKKKRHSRARTNDHKIEGSNRRR